MGAGEFDHRQLAQEIDMYTSGFDVGASVASSPFGMQKIKKKHKNLIF